MGAIALLPAPATVVDMPHAPVPKSDPFSFETDLAAPVREWLMAQPSVAVVGEEVDAGCGVADLVAGVGARLTRARAPFVDALATGVLERAAGGVAEEQLREWAPYGWRSLHRRTLAPLLAQGLLSRSVVDGVVTYRAVVDTSDPYTALVAVELKLSAWRRAIAQAGRYRLFAEQSFIALPAARVGAAVVAEAARNRVGVLAVEDDLSVRVAHAPATVAPIQAHRRRWASEQVLRSVTTPGARRAGTPII